jgi:hypothetical protein
MRNGGSEERNGCGTGTDTPGDPAADGLSQKSVPMLRLRMMPNLTKHLGTPWDHPEASFFSFLAAARAVFACSMIKKVTMVCVQDAMCARSCGRREKEM